MTWSTAIFQVALVLVAVWVIRQSIKRHAMFVTCMLRIAIAEFERRLRDDKLRPDQEIDDVLSDLQAYMVKLQWSFNVPQYRGH